MRIWSLSPKYLDQKGLVAVWREGLLAQKVLEGKTKGYKNHPQFKKCQDPLETIGTYLYVIADEAQKRNYNFDYGKIKYATATYERINPLPLTVTKGQLEYEFDHLQKKLWTRNINKRTENGRMRFADFEGFVEIETIQPHPIFKIVEGDIESFERIK
jgi:hypothetical protein